MTGFVSAAHKKSVDSHPICFLLNLWDRATVFDYKARKYNLCDVILVFWRQLNCSYWCFAAKTPEEVQKEKELIKKTLVRKVRVHFTLWPADDVTFISVVVAVTYKRRTMPVYNIHVRIQIRHYTSWSPLRPLTFDDITVHTDWVYAEARLSHLLVVASLAECWLACNHIHDIHVGVHGHVPPPIYCLLPTVLHGCSVVAIHRPHYDV